jgi:hypothetical protein
VFKYKMFFTGFILAKMYLLWIQSVKRIESYPGAKKADVFIPISIEYHKEVILKEIERKLLNKERQNIWTKKLSNVVT